jgi:hypothetical protein
MDWFFRIHISFQPLHPETTTFTLHTPDCEDDAPISSCETVLHLTRSSSPEHQE